MAQNHPQFNLVSITTRKTNEKDKAELIPYDHTKCSNINTCPTWGVIRYSLHKKMEGASRAMALEAGAAAHEGFAAVKWYQFHSKQAVTTTLSRIAENQGARIFGEDRFERMKNTLSKTANERTNVINFTLEALYSSDFYDDPNDRNRTVSNISDSLIAYIDRWDMDRYPIWIRDEEDPYSDLGIEIPYDIRVDVVYSIGSGRTAKEHHKAIRYTGKIDGLGWDAPGVLISMENKTGARIDDAWLAQWILSHQITGYNVAATTFTGVECTRAFVEGMKIPLGKVVSDGIRKEAVNRSQTMFSKWVEWLIHTVEIDERYRDQPLDAPMYTHSCNRYFRPCSFVPLCAEDDREQKELILEEMTHDEWSPLEDSVQG